mgnify:FL=1
MGLSNGYMKMHEFHEMRHKFGYYDRDPNLVKDQFICRLLDQVTVKGKLKGTKVYELISKMDVSDKKSQLDYIKRFEDAQQCYFDRQWDQSISLFQSLKAERDYDYLVELYLNRCFVFKEDPPSDDWDGVFRLTTK